MQGGRRPGRAGVPGRYVEHPRQAQRRRYRQRRVRSEVFMNNAGRTLRSINWPTMRVPMRRASKARRGRFGCTGASLVGASGAGRVREVSMSGEVAAAIAPGRARARRGSPLHATWPWWARAFRASLQRRRLRIAVFRCGSSTVAVASAAVRLTAAAATSRSITAPSTSPPAIRVSRATCSRGSRPGSWRDGTGESSRWAVTAPPPRLHPCRVTWGCRV